MAEVAPLGVARAAAAHRGAVGQVATIPVGYADGYGRILSNRAEVLCRGRRHRQVGNVCMDPVEEGYLVTLMGVDGDEEITAEELAELSGTINYEVVCDFGLRLEKVYV